MEMSPFIERWGCGDASVDAVAMNQWPYHRRPEGGGLVMYHTAFLWDHTLSNTLCFQPFSRYPSTAFGKWGHCDEWASWSSVNRSDVAVDTGVAMRGCPCSIFYHVVRLVLWHRKLECKWKCLIVSNGGSAHTGQISSFLIYWASKQEIVREIYAIALNRHMRPFVLFSLYPINVWLIVSPVSSQV